MEVDDWVGRSPGGAGESLACAEALGEDSEMGREGPARVWLPHLNTRPALGADAELLQSMLESLRETERIRAFKAAGGAREHLCFRKLLVEWIIDVCADFKLSMGTAALAVTYTDNVLMLVSVPPTSLQLVAMACILVAAKYEEQEIRVPPVERLQQTANCIYSQGHLKQMEVAVLCELQWSLSRATPVHFVESYLVLSGGGILAEDRLAGHRGLEPVPLLHSKVAELVASSLLHFDLCSEVPPSSLAGAILLTSRRAMAITPVWPAQLARLTGFEQHELEAISQRLVSATSQPSSAPAPSAPAPAGPAHATDKGAHKSGALVPSPKSPLDWDPQDEEMQSAR